MKPVKAIDLVFRAQPMIATLREIITRNCDDGVANRFVDDCDAWLRAAQVLMTRKGGGK